MGLRHRETIRLYKSYKNPSIDLVTIASNPGKTVIYTERPYYFSYTIINFTKKFKGKFQKLY